MEEREAPPRPRAVPLMLAVLTLASCGARPGTHRSDGDLLAGALHSLGLRRDALAIRLQHAAGALPHPRSVGWVPVWFEAFHASPSSLHQLAEDLGRAAAHLGSPAVSEPEALRELVLQLGVAWWRPELEPGVRDRGSSHEPPPRDVHLPAGLEPIVVELVGTLVAAARRQHEALRRLPPDAIDAVWRTCGREAHGGDRGARLAHVDEVARLLDRDALVLAALRAIETSQAARHALAAWLVEADPASLRTLRFETPTPFGRVVVRGTGDDVYALGAAGLGSADMRPPSSRSTRRWPADATTIGLFIDAAGNDGYWALDATRDTSTALPGRGNDRAWRDPAPPENGSYGLGLDAPAGAIPELAR
jgi:hypothetical protein